MRLQNPCDRKVHKYNGENSGKIKIQMISSVSPNTLFGFNKTDSQNGLNKAIEIGNISSAIQ